MSAEGNRLPNLPVIPRKRRMAQPLHEEELVSDSSRISFGHLGRILFEKHLLMLGISSAIFAFAVWFSIGYVLRNVAPQDMVTVQQFEVAPQLASHFPLSGKNASDVVVDTLNDVATHAREFHGVDYFKYDGVSIQPVALQEPIKIPIETSYGIELKGISLDSILALYRRVRFQQWIINGDVLPTPDGLVARIRCNRDDTAKSWESQASQHTTPSELVREATLQMLTGVNPELLGQAYLQEKNYDAAVDVFRRWALDDPQNWKPTYYLSLTYGYKKDQQLASDMANWSDRVSKHKPPRQSQKPSRSANPRAESAANLAQATKVDLETGGVPDPTVLSKPEAILLLDRLKYAVPKLAKLCQIYPANADYRIQYARMLDKQALAKFAIDSASLAPAKDMQLGIDTLDEAMALVPENGGLHEQRGIFLKDMVTILKGQNADSKLAADKEQEEISEYIRALELRPQESSPLWAATYAMLELGEGDSALSIARTIRALRPDSLDARTAYLVSLEKVIYRDARGSERKDREREAETLLNEVLQASPDKGQLYALWSALVENHDETNLHRVAVAGRRLFPTDDLFRAGKSTTKTGSTPVRSMPSDGN